jgi:hypothetical protein
MLEGRPDARAATPQIGWIQLDVAAIRLPFAGKQLEKGGLAASVGSNCAGPSLVDPEAQVDDQRDGIAMGEGNVG